MKLTDLPKSAVCFNGLYFTPSGKAYRLVNESLIEAIYTRIGKKGHVILSAGGETIYLARLIYAAFVFGNPLKYYEMNDYIVRYKDNDYSNCEIGNIYMERKGLTKNKKMAIKRQAWLIRKSFCMGESVSNIARRFNVSEVHVRGLCAGFDSDMLGVCDGVLDGMYG